jgi:hypothetical protein
MVSVRAWSKKNTKQKTKKTFIATCRAIVFVRVWSKEKNKKQKHLHSHLQCNGLSEERVVQGKKIKKTFIATCRAIVLVRAWSKPSFGAAACTMAMVLK